MSDSAATQTNKKPELPPFPEARMKENGLSNIAKVDILIKYIEKVGEYLTDVKAYISTRTDDDAPLTSPSTIEEPEDDDVVKGLSSSQPSPPLRLLPPSGGGKKKQRKTKKKGGADIDYSKVYNVQGLIENISKSTGKDPIASQSVPAPFSTGSPLQRFGKKEAKSLPNELKNEIIPDYSQDGGKKKKTEKKKMPKKK